MEIWILNIGETESARQLATKQWNERVVVASGGEESNPQSAAQTESASALTPFHIETRAGIPVIVWKSGGCRPASAAESELWKELSAKTAEVEKWRRMVDDNQNLNIKQSFENMGLVTEDRRLREACEKLLNSEGVQESWPLDGDKRAQKPADTFSKAVAMVKFRDLLRIHQALSAPATVKEHVRDGEWVEKAAWEIVENLVRKCDRLPEEVPDTIAIIRRHLPKPPTGEREGQG